MCGKRLSNRASCGKVPERAREIVNRGSEKSIADLERNDRYMQAREAAASPQRQAADAQQLEGAASAPAPQARAGTSGQPSQSAAPEAGSTDQPRLVDRLPVYRAQAQSPATGAFSNQPALSNPQYEYMKNNATTINSNLKSFWIAMGGKEDIAYNNCKIMMGKFDELGVKYSYSEYPGGHTWPVWRNNLYNFAQLLFK